MNEQNSTSVVRAAYEAFQRGDIDGALALMSDDIDWNSPAVEGMPFGGPCRGKNAVADFFTKLNESEEILAFEPREYITQGERVAVLGSYQARVRATGRVVSSPWIHVFTVRDGRVTNFFELYDTAATERAYQRAASA
jgi:ketosteroid isomerase-like protein